MKVKNIIKIGALLGGLAVILGAFGAHGLESTLQKFGREDTYETAVKYHFYHSLAILLAGILGHIFPQSPKIRQSFWFFLGGIILFSGSLYLFSLSGITWLATITPFGGVAFIVGWVWLFWGAGKNIS